MQDDTLWYKMIQDDTLWYKIIQGDTQDNTLWAFFFFFKTLIFWVVRWVKSKNGPRWQNIMFVVPYISANTKSYDLHLWYTSVKISRCKNLTSVKIILFHLVSEYIRVYHFVGYLWGKRAKNGRKWKKIMLVTLREHISYDHDFWCTCVKGWDFQVLFFIFSKFWFPGLLGG